MTVPGRTINSMVRVSKLGLRELAIRAATSVVKSKDLVTIPGLMAQNTPVSGVTTRSTEWVRIYGRMDVNTTGPG
jgi:hypothetical protein